MKAELLGKGDKLTVSSNVTILVRYWSNYQSLSELLSRDTYVLRSEVIGGWFPLELEADTVLIFECMHECDYREHCECKVSVISVPSKNLSKPVELEIHVDEFNKIDFARIDRCPVTIVPKEDEEQEDDVEFKEDFTHIK